MVTWRKFKSAGPPSSKGLATPLTGLVQNVHTCDRIYIYIKACPYRIVNTGTAFFIAPPKSYSESPYIQATRNLDLTRHNDLKRSASLRDLARINALSAPHTGSWLLAIPNFNLGLAMTPQEFVIALRIRLGLSLFPFPPAFTRCFCGHAIDPFADHVLSCGTGPLRSKRHDALCDVLHHTLLIDNSSCRREQRCLSDDNSRPGDLYHPDFHLGRPAYFDITVRNSLLPQQLVFASWRCSSFWRKTASIWRLLRALIVSFIH